MKQKFHNTSLLLPKAVKRALDLVAADQGTKAGPLLREKAREIVTTYKDGIFFDMAVRDAAQSDLQHEQQASE